MNLCSYVDPSYIRFVNSVIKIKIGCHKGQGQEWIYCNKGVNFSPVIFFDSINSSLKMTHILRHSTPLFYQKIFYLLAALSVSAIHIPGIWSQKPGIWPHVFRQLSQDPGCIFSQMISTFLGNIPRFLGSLILISLKDKVSKKRTLVITSTE